MVRGKKEEEKTAKRRRIIPRVDTSRVLATAMNNLRGLSVLYPNSELLRKQGRLKGKGTRRGRRKRKEKKRNEAEGNDEIMVRADTTLAYLSYGE